MLKTKKSPHKKDLNKTASHSTLLKKTKSKQMIKTKIKNVEKQRDKERDDVEQTKLKKRIESMQTPELLLKIHYKGKKLSVPVSALEKSSLKELVEPFVLRFETEILKNSSFDPSSILNWKTILNPSILKDYYFQLNLPMEPFKGEMIDIEPIFRAKINKMLQLRDFEVLKCIGTGGFSKVFLARKKATGKFYALKLMEKEGLSESGKECVVTNERDIMAELNHPRILSMEAAFQTNGFIVFVLEYCPGGELFYYLRKVRRMNEQDARFCFVEILTAFQYLHSKGIVYRDVKPQNILIDADGHLKLADFGLSRAGLGKDELAYTYCGSPEYMAPEMLSKSGHSFAVDYYCLGALLYELVTGNPPFYSRDVEKIYYSIEHDEIDFPSHIEISPELQMLLSGLLMKDPRRRLGSLGGIRQILSHPWVRKLKAADVLEGRVETPVKIDLMTFNINEDEIGDAEEKFEEKLREEEHVSSTFEPMFEDFYFSKEEPFNILNEVDNSHKPIGSSDSKMTLTIKKNYKSKQREQSKSKSRDLGSKEKKLRKMKSSKRLINQSEALIERGKRRMEPSLPKKETKKREKLLSPKPADRQGNRQAKLLKRVKSTDTLGRLLR